MYHNHKTKKHMTKAQLEIKIESLNETLNMYKKLYTEAHEQLKEVTDKVSRIDEIKQDALYENFKSQYSVFLNRYMKEWMSEHVSIHVNGNNTNYVEVALGVDNEIICCGDDSISVSGTVRNYDEIW